MSDLSGSRALVTGAAGGIGREIVARFADAGAEVFAVDVSQERLGELEEAVPGVRGFVTDIADPAGCDAVVASAGGRIDILVNSAAVIDGHKLLGEVGDDEWERVLRVNLTGPFMLATRVVGAMLEAGSGVILNVASVAGVRGGRAGLAYTASKHGLVGLTLNVAATLGGDGIRCNAVCPGGTTGNQSFERDLSPRGAARITGRDRGRPAAGRPERVADVVVWLAGPEAERLNGAIIPVDDGWIAY